MPQSSDSTCLMDIQNLLDEWRTDGQTGSLTLHFDGQRVAKMELHYFLKKQRLDI